jgi:hypothetical protein
MKKWIKVEEIITLMKEDWELGFSSGGVENGRYWLQKGGLCRGGDTIDVHSKTIDKLEKENLIEVNPRRKDDSYGLRRYRLK